MLKAERRFGLPADGMADQTLLDHLMADLAKTNIEPAAGNGWTLDDGMKLTEILGALLTFTMTILGFLGFRSD